MTVYGRNLNSVAAPRIILTVIITRFDNDSKAISTTTNSSSEVLNVHHIVQLSHGVVANFCFVSFYPISVKFCVEKQNFFSQCGQ